MMHPSIWGGLLFLGVISTACGFLLWNRGLQMLNASFLGWLFLGEQVGLSFGIGTLLIFIGVLLVIREE